MLRQIIERTEKRLSELGKQRAKRTRELAIGRAYPKRPQNKRISG